MKTPTPETMSAASNADAPAPVIALPGAAAAPVINPARTKGRYAANVVAPYRLRQERFLRKLLPDRLVQLQAEYEAERDT